MVLHGPGNGADAHGRAQGDQAVAQHGAEARRNASPKTALDGALDAQHVDGADGRGDKNSDDDADGDNERIGQKLHAPSFAGPRREP